MKTRSPKLTSPAIDRVKAVTMPSGEGTRRVPEDDELPVLVYEQKLEKNSGWALREGSCHFDEKSVVFDALRKIAKRLEDLNIPYGCCW